MVCVRAHQIVQNGSFIRAPPGTYRKAGVCVTLMKESSRGSPEWGFCLLDSPGAADWNGVRRVRAKRGGDGVRGPQLLQDCSQDIPP